MIAGAVAGLRAVAEAAEAAVSPTASAEAPVAVTTDRREGVVARGAGGRGDGSCDGSCGPGADCCSSTSARGRFPDGVLTPEVFAF
ncbi:hypothetical protein GCM10010451_43090 [Streptomyces virens]|uniref:Secreted protein n=1 Tax=Streptomyces virens TaxID=285572 RepID=A0ABP6PVV6_9ACTN